MISISLFFFLLRNVTVEEREAKYLRMLTSSLLGIKRLLSLLIPSDRETFEQRLQQLINSAKFWKYSKHKTPQVKTSAKNPLQPVTCIL